MSRMAIKVFVCAVLMTLAAGSLSAQQIKIGVVDPVRVSEETAEGQRIQTRLKKFSEDKQSEITALENQLTNLQKDYRAQALSLSADKRANMVKQIQLKQLELSSMRDAASRQFQLEFNEANDRFQAQLLQAVDEYGRREGFALILDRNQVAWAAQTVDVTTGVVDLFNQLFSGS